MNWGAAAFVSFRYLLGKGREGGRYLRGAVLGIALSLVPIIVTLVVADGLIQGITARYLELGTGHIQLYERIWEMYESDPLPTIQATEGVTAVWRERQGLGIVVGKKGKSGATVRAVDPSFLTSPGVANYLEVISGEATLQGEYDILLGSEMAKKTGASIGDTVRLMTARVDASGRTIPRILPFTVRGVISAGYRELDALWCLIPHDTGVRLLPLDSSRAFWGIKVDNPASRSREISNNLMASLGAGFLAYTWDELQSAQYKSYASTRQLLLFIMALVVLVAAVNVSSATSMLVLERRRDIALLKCCGSSPRFLNAVFLMGAFWTGLLGAAFGLAAGLFVAVNINNLVRGVEWIANGALRLGSLVSGESGAAPLKILDPSYYLERIPIIIDWSTIAVIGIATVLCSVLVASFPAVKSGKLSPTEILRRY